MFIGREDELKFLEDKYHTDEGQFIVIYGRRRVGKTELLREFCKDKPHIFYTCTEIPDEQQLKSFGAKILATGLPAARYISSFSGWEQAFGSICEIPISEKKVLIIDEFPYAVKNNNSIPSMLQKVWDEHLKDQNVMVVISGSSMSFIEDEILSEHKPLYGRATGVMKILPMSFYEAIEFFPSFNNEEKIAAFSILGGIPHYLKQFDDRMSLEDNIKKNILTKGCVLYSEVEFLLKQELRDVNVYNVIIEAVALGNTKLNDIHQRTSIDKNKLSVYIKNLIELGIIVREFSVDENTKEHANSQRGLYFLTDNFFKFWYSFIFPYISEIESGDAEGIWEYAIKGNLNNFVSYGFEKVCIEFLRKKNRENTLPFHFTKIGRWWNKQDEIDIMALSNDKKSIILGECKYRNSPIDNHDINRTLKKYKTSSDVNVFHYFFSRSGYTADVLKNFSSPQITLISLNDIFNDE